MDNQRSSRSGSGSEAGTPLRVLLVEDSENDALLLLRELRRGGYAPEWRQVCTAADLTAALDETWQIVFCDYVMPGFSGPAAVEMIRARAPDLPVIMVSGEVDEDCAVTAMRAGANDFVLKNRLSRLLPALDRELHEAETRAAGQRALRAAEERLRLLVEQSPVGIVVTDAAGRVTDVNPAALSILGSPSAEATKQFNVLELPNLRAAGVTGAFELALHRGEPQQLAGTYVSVWGKRSEVQFDVVPLRDGGGICGTITILQDCTERIRAEEEIRTLNRELETGVAQRTVELEAANRELQAFSSAVSHDLRAPLRAIDGFAAAVLEDHGGELPAPARDHLQRIRGAARRMGALISELLALARVAQGELRRQPIDLSALARAIAGELQRTAPDRRVEFAIAEDLTAAGDPALIRVVLENLLGNAFKYSARHPTARIGFGCAVRDGQSVFLVRDDGAGFDMAHADRLFRPFQRLHAADDFEGTGIGLATVQRIVHRHGGRIWAEAAVEQGASFYFTLGAYGGSTRPGEPE